MSTVHPTTHTQLELLALEIKATKLIDAFPTIKIHLKSWAFKTIKATLDELNELQKKQSAVISELNQLQLKQSATPYPLITALKYKL